MTRRRAQSPSHRHCHDPEKLGFKGAQHSTIANPERWTTDDKWLDNKPVEQPRRSNPSTAACNWMEEILNVWNTNLSMTLNVGAVLAYLTNCV
jgi:hypothetical protein